MDDAGRVRVDEAAQDVIADAAHLAPGKRSVLPDALRERLADQTLHHEERLAVFGVVHLEHAGNEVAPDALRRFRLPVQPHHQDVVDEEAADDLDRDLRARLEVGRGKDLPHSASTNQRVDAELVAQDVAGLDRQMTTSRLTRLAPGPSPLAPRPDFHDREARQAASRDASTLVGRAAAAGQHVGREA